MSGFDGVENQTNGPDLTHRLSQDPRDQPLSLLSSSPCFPITLKVNYITHTQTRFRICNTNRFRMEIVRVGMENQNF